MIPHVAPPVYPSPIRQGRFASTLVLNSPELAEATGARAGESAVAKCSVGLLGIPDDTGVVMNGGRAGAAQGPHAFRAALSRYGVAAPLDEPADRPAYPRVFDIGDVVPGQTLEATHRRVSDAARALVGMGLLPVAVGGGHDGTFAFVRGVAEGMSAAGQPVRPLAGVYFDAHLDVRPEEGSGMSFRALWEQGYLVPGGLICLGVDRLVNTREHFEYFAGRGGSIDVFEPEHWPAMPAEAAGRFVSLDLDVLDMAYAPGVSAMNPCGWSPERVGNYVEVAGRAPEVCCFDIMELSPAHDEGGRTARLAAWMFLRFLRGVGERK